MGPASFPLAALACDHKNGSVPLCMRIEQKRNKRRPSVGYRLAMEIDTRIRRGLPSLHASELLLIHAKRWPADAWHRGK